MRRIRSTDPVAITVDERLRIERADVKKHNEGRTA
jgi:hypothetical protein